MSDLLDGLKETEIGPIPEEWEVVNIADVIDDTISGDWGKGNNDEHQDWIRCQVIRGTDFPTVAPGQLISVPERYVRPSSIKKRQLRPDDMLVEISGGSKYQPTGRILRITAQVLSSGQLPLLFTNFVKLFRVDRNTVEPSFFYLFWRYLYSLGRTRIYEKRTTGIRNFKYKDFLTSEIIPLPPLPEQRRIAHVLSTIQRAIATQDDLIAAAKETKRSVMQRLFTYGPGPEPAPTKGTEIGQIPEHWEMVRLGDAFAIQQGKALSREKDKGVSPYPFLRTSNVQWAQIDLSTVDEMDFTEEEVQKYALRPGDLLVCEGGEIGRTAIWKLISGVYCYQNHLHRLRPIQPDIYPPFYMYWMQAALLILNLYQGVANITTIANLSQSRLSRFLLPKPSLDEQQEIARILSATDRKIAAEEQGKAALQELFRTMLNQLMTGRIRVRDLELR